MFLIWPFLTTGGAPAVLETMARHARRIVYLSSEQVHTIGEAIGRPLRFEKVPVQLAREQMLADGRPAALVEALLAGAETRPESHLVTSTVEEITGAPARTFRSWAEEHADAFR
ncbi:hypothetical protein [Streptomyces decoyicus]|uniref:hypothetical protein n=1 Tax=Streptomyces decoyicus TaxID=249567 RepID=UPI002E17260F|nr:hypothetical protein OG532_01260 [Streptomyces decoyicus]